MAGNDSDKEFEALRRALAEQGSKLEAFRPPRLPVSAGTGSDEIPAFLFETWLSPKAALQILGDRDEQAAHIEALLTWLCMGSVRAAALQTHVRAALGGESSASRRKLTPQFWSDHGPNAKSAFWSTGTLSFEAEVFGLRERTTHTGVKFEPSGIAALAKSMGVDEPRAKVATPHHSARAPAPPPEEIERGNAPVVLHRGQPTKEDRGPYSTDSPDGSMDPAAYERWIQPPVAIKKLEPILHPNHAKAEIHRRICGGEILTVARTSNWHRQGQIEVRDYVRLTSTLWATNPEPEDYDLLWKTGTHNLTRTISHRYSTREKVECFGIRFDPAGINTILTDAGVAPLSAPAAPPIEDRDGRARPTRAPSVKAARPPSDDAIVAKADEMRGRGMTTYEIAKRMRFEPGFEDVATRTVRDLIRGRYPRTGRAGLSE